MIFEKACFQRVLGILNVFLWVPAETLGGLRRLLELVAHARPTDIANRGSGRVEVAVRHPSADDEATTTGRRRRRRRPHDSNNKIDKHLNTTLHQTLMPTTHTPNTDCECTPLHLACLDDDQEEHPNKNTYTNDLKNTTKTPGNTITCEKNTPPGSLRCARARRGHEKNTIEQTNTTLFRKGRGAQCKGMHTRAFFPPRPHRLQMLQGTMAIEDNATPEHRH